MNETERTIWKDPKYAQAIGMDMILRYIEKFKPTYGEIYREFEPIMSGKTLDVILATLEVAHIIRYVRVARYEAVRTHKS